MTDPVWLKIARAYIGQKEVKGAKSNDWILSLWDSVTWIWAHYTRKDDSLAPWCGAFMRHVMVESNIKPPSNWWRAKAWSKWGRPLHRPMLGCIGIMTRKDGGHVGIIVGKDNANNLLVLGGNQNDSVSIAAFDQKRFTEFVWPTGHVDRPHLGELPILSAALSASEA